MNLHDDPGAVFRKALPEAPPPTTPFDLDRIVHDGYRARRRHRAALGAAATTAVAAVAAVLALSITGFPSGFADQDDPADTPAAGGIEDPSMAGYPYVPGDLFGAEAEREALREAAVKAFGPMLSEAGVIPSEYFQAPTEEEIQAEMERSGIVYEEALAFLMPYGNPLSFAPKQTPGNYGQTWLRSYTALASDEEGNHTVLRLEAMLPGGWTAEPGPFTQQLFPQHLISPDGDSWRDGDVDDAELVTDELDDGRTLIIADRGCAFEAAVVYPNGSGLRASWDTGCGNATEEYETSSDAFYEAVAAMPEVDYDTSDLSPVEDLIEVPTGWLFDQDWEQSEDAVAASAESIWSASTALQASAPGSVLTGPSAIQIGMATRGSVVTRAYHGSGDLAYQTTEGAYEAAPFDLNYHLPGGWVPGIGEEGEIGLHPAYCLEGYTCSESTDSDGTVWTFEEGEESEGRRLQVTRFDPEGWAVSIAIGWGGDPSIDSGLLVGILRDMPAPTYDATEVPVIPAG